MVPRAVDAGAEVLTLCQAVRLRSVDKRVVGVEAVALDAQTRRAVGRVQIDAPRVCLSASATGSAALLMRSGVADPSGTVGRGLRLHPAVVVAGEFADPVRAYRGIPQSIECTEWLELERRDGHGVWIVPAFAHPVGTATMIPGHGETHRRLMRRYDHLAVLTAMVHDRTAGAVDPDGDLGVSIDYRPNAGDCAELRHGLWACAKLLQAAGAERIHVPARAPRSFAADGAVDGLRGIDVLAEAVPLTAVHPMASVPMHDDPARGAVGSDGRHHHLEGLWIADGSLFPSSIGVPPQMSIYAMGLHVGRQLVASA
jgi:choline dehydrogenase-like flavoprotein